MATDICAERHRVLDMFVRYLIAAVMAAFVSVASLYLYGNEKYAQKDDLALMRQEIKEGFARIEKRLP
jgi:hypothetical protein